MGADSQYQRVEIAIGAVRRDDPRHPSSTAVYTAGLSTESASASAGEARGRCRRRRARATIEGMITLDAAQIWTIIGVGSASVLGMLTLMSTTFVRVIRAEIGSVRTEVSFLRDEMRYRFEAVDQRFDSVDRRLDGLDRDVQGIIGRELGQGGAAGRPT